MKAYNKEQVYDEKLRPHVDAILEICKAEGLPMICTICYAKDTGSGASFATCAAFGDDPPGILRVTGMVLHLPGVRPPAPPAGLGPFSRWLYRMRQRIMLRRLGRSLVRCMVDGKAWSIAPGATPENPS